ncbi:MAG: DUF350 domain-containing protein [Patescibacteria group bacterium]
MDLNILWVGVLESLIYSAIGLVIALVAFFIMDLLTPGHLGKQLAKDQNMALAIVVGSGILGVCIIIASAIHG